MNRQAVIQLLRECRYDAEAGHAYDIMRGGLVWDDELPSQYEDSDKYMRSILLLAEVIAYRASLTSGDPNPKYARKWRELRTILPSWPGFREERIYGEVERELRIVKRLEARCLDRMDAELDSDVS